MQRRQNYLEQTNHTKVLLDTRPGYTHPTNRSPAYQLEGTTIEAFDLLEFQRRARETCCPKTLFAMWEDVCRRYDQHQIGEYQFEEMKAVIWPNLTALASLRRAINAHEPEAKPKRRKSA